MLLTDAVAEKIGADKLVGKSEAYIEARFDSLTDGDAPAQFHKPETKTDARSDAAKVDADDAAFRATLAAKRKESK